MAKNQEQKKIGQFIARLREQRGLTQNQFAKALHTSQPAVTRMEKGQQNFSTEMLAKISKVLNQEIITLADTSAALQIKGGHKLSGTAVVNASKNAAVALMCAALLNEGTTTLRHVPKIEEVYRMIEVLVSIGVTVRWSGGDLIIRPAGNLTLNKINKEAAVQTRSVLLLLAPLIHRLKSFSLPLAGGCKLGARTVRPHLYALEKLGVEIKTIHDHHNIRVGKLKPAEIVLYEMGDTVTENALMAASKIEGKTVIKFASSNYMVQDLCHFLTKLGVRVEGIGTPTLTVYGKEEIDQNIEYYLSEDPIEAMMFLSLAATTNSSLTIRRCPINFLELELLKLSKMGLRFKILKRYKSRNETTNLVDIKTFHSKLVALEEKIHPLPYPGINIDNLPFFVPIATRAQGTTLIHDWVYENRAVYYMELNKLRADIKLADPYRVYVTGPSQLKGAEVICPPALRPAVIILIAMLAAEGTSLLRNVYSINRGYENLVVRLRKLGAKIEILHGL
jgi:UDP-N-acetylglucosamine 1-carboxyvinyltransferase